MFEIPSHAPSEFIAGDTVEWTESLRDFSSLDGWALAFRAVGPEYEIPPGKIAATANGAGGWSVVLAAADSNVAPGTYRLFGWVTLNGERHTVLDRAIEIRPNLAAGDPVTLKSQNQQTLEAIDARLSGRISGDQEQVQINGTAITHIPIDELVKLRGLYASKVWREFHPHRSFPVHAMRFR